MVKTFQKLLMMVKTLVFYYLNVQLKDRVSIVKSYNAINENGGTFS